MGRFPLSFLFPIFFVGCSKRPAPFSSAAGRPSFSFSSNLLFFRAGLRLREASPFNFPPPAYLCSCGKNSPLSFRRGGLTRAFLPEGKSLSFREKAPLSRFPTSSSRSFTEKSASSPLKGRISLDFLSTPVSFLGHGDFPFVRRGAFFGPFPPRPCNFLRRRGCSLFS